MAAGHIDSILDTGFPDFGLSLGILIFSICTPQQ
jgi:hypothetical protein